MDDIDLCIKATYFTLSYSYYHSEYVIHLGNSLGFNDFVIKSLIAGKDLITVLGSFIAKLYHKNKCFSYLWCVLNILILRESIKQISINLNRVKMGSVIFSSAAPANIST